MVVNRPATAPEILDLTGKFCPEVVLCVRSRVRTLPAGSALAVVSTDPLSEIDIPLYAMRAGLSLERVQRVGEAILYHLVLPAGGPPARAAGDDSCG